MTTRTQVFSNVGNERAAWLDAWQECGSEPFAHPGYIESFSSADDAPRLVRIDTDAGPAIVPVILRRIPGGGDGRTAIDASSPYGYGGPYGEGSVSDGVWQALFRAMEDLGAVSMFGRLALGAPAPELAPPGLEFRSDSENVVVDLARPAADQWSHYEHKVRKNVNKARRAGLVCEVNDSFTSLAEFAELYGTTMSRREAAARYRFGADFFEALTAQIAGSYVAAEVREASGRLVSAELVLCSDTFLYSFLGGTLAESFPHAPNDLLKHAVTDYGRESGRTGYVLGGGYRPGDGIFRYKRAFDPTGVQPFLRMEMVVDEPAYASLVQSRRDAVREAGIEHQLDPTFFPLYRSGPVLGADD